jgi:hypothetical protein
MIELPFGISRKGHFLANKKARLGRQARAVSMPPSARTLAPHADAPG